MLNLTSMMMLVETSHTANLMVIAQRVADKLRAQRVEMAPGREYIRFVACGSQVRCFGNSDSQCIVDLIRVSDDGARTVIKTGPFAGAAYFDERFAERMGALVKDVLLGGWLVANATDIVFTAKRCAS